MLDRTREPPWPQLGAYVAEWTGLHFPPERWGDLQRGLAGAARELGFENVAAFAAELLATPPSKTQLRVLVDHLTVGETYFFRDRKTFDALASTILPELIRARRGREQRLRFWSAGCSTGEEAYSLAILVHQALPDLPDWHVTITATDINERFLHKAAAGVYGEWSFRDAPPGLRERHFRRTAGGRFAVLPAIRKMVQFAPLNLVADGYPSLATGTNAMDLIFCRNVLMYLTPAHVRRVVAKLEHSLAEGGWLAVGPAEAARTMFSRFAAVNFPGATLFRKRDTALPAEPLRGDTAAETPEAAEAATLAAPPSAPPSDEPAPASQTAMEALYRQGRYAETVRIARSLIDRRRRQRAAPDRRARGPAPFSLLARALANQGDLAEALGCCESWIAVAKLDPAAHYVHAMILQERGDRDAARRSLERAVYLDPHFVMAHFALGNLARSEGRPAFAVRHFAEALRLLGRCPPGEELPESDGQHAGRLVEIIKAMTGAKADP